MTVFYKYHGAGNDFIVFSEPLFQKWSSKRTRDFIQKVCHRRFGVGADGVMVIRKYSGSEDFLMDFFNSDGLPGSFCGNGARCASQFALEQGIVKNPTDFGFLFGETKYRGRIAERNWVSIRFPDVGPISRKDGLFFVDTGSPHIVIESSAQDWKVLEGQALAIRNSERFRQEGVNVNFIARGEDEEWRLSTFERGVEDFTYACGTGAVAVAVFLLEKGLFQMPVKLRSKGGLLSVELEKGENDSYENVWLSGPAVKVFEGELYIEEQ
jgi:diaminopimelate epimerase